MTDEALCRRCRRPFSAHEIPFVANDDADREEADFDFATKGLLCPKDRTP